MNVGGQQGEDLITEQFKDYVCFLESGYAYFKGVLTQMQKSNGQRLCKTKANLLLKMVYAWGKPTHHDLPGE